MYVHEGDDMPEEARVENGISNYNPVLYELSGTK